MGIHTADAIVLRQYPYRETSVLVTCLTDRFGKIKGLIKGLRGVQPSRYRSAMEPLTLNRIVFYDTRASALHLISQCDLLEPFGALTGDLASMQTAASCAELADVVVESDEPQGAIFDLLTRTLRRLACGDTRLAAVRIHFVLRLLRLAGFHPQLDECTGCTQSLQGQRACWSARQGGLLCERCLHQDPQAEPMAPQLLDTLSACAQAPEPLALEAEEAQAIRQRLDTFLRWQLDRPLKTMKNVEWQTSNT